ncbi:MAG: type II CAAX endopeptidase family protein [Lachnospiraceae bacterium]|nr:type II CAAX endopeptidase family protein [Lachnospiraceae bacterium]
MKYTRIQKKQLLIYILVAYGIPYLMGFLMWYGYGQGTDLSAFANAQMMYPAAGVILAFLVTKREEEIQLPKRFFITYLVITAVMLLLSIASVVVPMGTLWMGMISSAIIVGSIIAWIMLLTEKKEKRKAFGLRAARWKSSLFCILLFVVLYFARTAIAYALGGQISMMGDIFTSRNTWIMLAVLPVNFFLVFVAFFGEEYGWRYFLQPMLQKRFGLRAGVILLGVLWGIWHLPINFFYYSPGSGLASAAGQQITCITLGIFFAYAYMKTQNIWVPVILHYLNNNLVPIITASYGADVLQNQQTSWSALLPALLLNGLVFGFFLLAKEFRKKDPKVQEIGEGER